MPDSRLPEQGAHVVVGLSGGVDSSVSAYLLKERGYRVSGLFMVNWTEDELGYCTAAEDFQDARKVCDELGIPLHRVDFSREYRERVFERFLAAYRAGKTPNPDVLCNREVKFQPFREYALRLGADYVATGHYARIAQAPDGPRLLRAADENKDQTYFLATVERAMLERVLFPVGHLLKSQVREIAQRAGLPNHDRRDSTGICFIGERPFQDFLSHYLKPSPGPIEDDAGRALGEHQGLSYYTLGQRRGLHVGGRRGAREAPWYVVAKDAARNALIVAQDTNHPRLMSRALTAAPFHWIRRPEPLPAPLLARIRHRQALQDCRANVLDDGRVRVEFERPQRAVVAGQFAALYTADECLGAGEIESADSAAS
ncbi:MAG: tRNA 2-thiouridine(34) synthase MnmA [Gammaproteobacteria bacterium]|nr:tRNA 2-thiouridine(34) synthase MnmA [Gammaproteobacteria bacterium]